MATKTEKAPFSRFQSPKALSLGVIRTFNGRFDAVAPFPRGAITELFGAAGRGKTQVCLQLCAAAQVGADRGGAGAKAAFLDSEGGFNQRRFRQICDVGFRGVDGVSTDNVLYKRLADVSDLEKAIESLFGVENLGLVVVDSLAFHFRYAEDEAEEPAQKSARLSGICQRLNRLAHIRRAAVVVTNHVTLDEDTPALGNAFAFYSSQRFSLRPHPSSANVKVIEVVKSGLVEAGKASNFVITEHGIRDVVSN